LCQRARPSLALIFLEVSSKVHLPEIVRRALYLILSSALPIFIIHPLLWVSPALSKAYLTRGGDISSLIITDYDCVHQDICDQVQGKDFLSNKHKTYAYSGLWEKAYSQIIFYVFWGSGYLRTSPVS